MPETNSDPAPHKRFWRYQPHPPVFYPAAAIILGFVVMALLFLKDFGQTVNVIQSVIADKAGWFYVMTMDLMLLFSVYLIFSRFKNVRIGGPDAKPDFSLWAWFAMLFSAGMGIGLLFYSVAEPMFHYVNPPTVPGRTVQAAQQAMTVTFYHWGLHAWGVYAVVGLALAYFSFNQGLPLTIRSAFYPLLGERIHGFLGNLVDTVAVVATLFGVATSLGLGVKQVNAGLHHLFGIVQSYPIQVGLITVITAIATASVVSGVERGIKMLSEINMILGLILLLFVLVLGPTTFLLNGLVQNIGYYVQKLPEMSSWTETYRMTNWQDDWTIFYWAWWIAWSPFVGMFIARISRGRTVREFMLGVLFVPTLITFIWLSVFGNTALYEEMFHGGGIADAVQQNVATALFVLLSRFPLSMVTSLLGIVVVVTFFVTSSDSGSLVIDIITAGGEPDPPIPQRVFWAVLEGVVAATLLVGGGLTALQTAAITTGLPFAVVLLFLAYSLYKGLSQDMDGQKALAPSLAGKEPGIASSDAQ